MPAVTTLEKIKLITRGEPKIQALTPEDAIVQAVLDQVDLEVQEAVFTNYTEIAQRYLAAHYLSQSLSDPGGRGPLSSETIGGVSQSWTLPYLNLHTVLGSTQYGMQFLEYRAKRIVPAVMIQPSA